jgi:hypothetical protein
LKGQVNEVKTKRPVMKAIAARGLERDGKVRVEG